MEQKGTKPSKPQREFKQTQRIFIRTFVRTSGGRTKSTEEQKKTFQNYHLFLQLFPIVFLIMTIGFFYILVIVSTFSLSRYLLLGIFSVILMREVSTLLFSFRMRNNILKPLESLQQAVEEVANGNYVTIDEKVPTMLSGLFNSFNKMSHQLKDGQEMKEKYERNRKELIAGISHDLKTPITSILGYIEGINEGVANSEEKLQTYMDIIYKNAKYTNQLIDDLFLFSKLDINQMEYNFEWINLKDYFEDIFIEKKIDLEEKGAMVTYEVNIQEERMMALDSKMIYRVISNLIGNAIKYNDKEFLVLKFGVNEVQGKKEMVEIMVEDNGVGIKKEHIKQVFDVFYRGDASRNKDVGGTGLGLSISRQLVEAHGGHIFAESEVGVGTRIYFTLKDQSRR